MVEHTGDSKTPGDKENPDPLPRIWASYPPHPHEMVVLQMLHVAMIGPVSDHVIGSGHP